MSDARFERCATIGAPPESVYAELTSPDRQLGLQPLLVALEELDSDAPDERRCYRAVERVPLFGGIALRNRIRVCIDRIRPPEVAEFEARSFPRITVTSRFTLTSIAAGTRVREEVRLTVPRFLRGFVLREAIRAQEALLANLDARLAPKRTPT